MSIFKLPDLGEGLPDAEINEWYVKEGDTVKLDQPIVSMETAKAVVDVPAPQAGVIKKLYGKPGDIIKTGAPLVEFENENKTAETAIKTKKQNVQNDTGTVVGNIVVGKETVKETAIIGSAGSSSASKSNIKATPAMRMLAQQLNVDLSAITPTGPNNTITSEDIKKAASHTYTFDHHNLDFEPLRGVRRTMAQNMAKSQAEIVPVTLVDDADIHAWSVDTDITTRIIRALIKACEAEPALNAWFNGKELSRHLFKEVNLGIAIDTTDGLFVPVIKYVAQYDAKALREKINQYKEESKNRTISPENLKYCTITLSNFGNFAGRYANPIIVPPTVAILGTGKMYEAAVKVSQKIEMHRMLPLSLTFDHRAVTGGEAARFMKVLIEALEKPI